MVKPAPNSEVDTTASELDLRTQVEDLERRFVTLRDQARQAQRLASLGTAAAMLAHEFNNLMTPVVGYAKYALDHDDVDMMKKALNMALRQTATLTSMANRILGLAIDEAQSLESVSVLACAEEAVACLCRDLSKDAITLRLEVDPGIKVWTDAKQLVQVLFNLLINARHAIGDGGGRVTIGADEIDDDRIAIRVKDSGCGIPADQIGSIFEPFFTTKRNGPAGERTGAGLGLAICKDIVEDHRGRIAVESTAGKGTTFTITLPSSA